MSQAVVQSNVAHWDGSNLTTSVTLTGVASGSAIEVRVSAWNGDRTGTFASVSDGGGAYSTAAQKAAAVTGGHGFTTGEIYYKLNVSSGNYTVVVTHPAVTAGNAFGWIWVGEISGRATSGALEATAGVATGTNTSPTVSCTGNTTATGMVSAVLSDDDGASAGIGSATGSSLAWANRLLDNTDTYESTSFDDAPTTSGITPTVSWGTVSATTEWVAVIACFKDAAGSNNTLIAPLGALTLTGLVPTFGQSTSIVAPLGSLTLAGLAPTFTQGHSLAAPLGTLTLTGLTASFAQPIALTAPLGTLTLSGLAPSITQGNSMTAPLGAMTLTGLAATMTQGNALTAPLGTITLQGLVPSIGQPVQMVAPLGSLSLTGLIPTFSQGNSLTAPLGSISLTGLAPTFGQSTSLVAPLGTINLVGLTSTFAQSSSGPNSLTAPLGAFTLTGLVPTFAQSTPQVIVDTGPPSGGGTTTRFNGPTRRHTTERDLAPDGDDMQDIRDIVALFKEMRKTQ